MITDCAARGSEPSLPAANATISKAALWRCEMHRQPPQWRDLPFSTDHQNARNREFEEREATASVEDDRGLESCPSPVLPV